VAIWPPSTPTFVLPYKRYASTDLLQLAKQYLDEPKLSLRRATNQGAAGQRMVYADDLQAAALSHCTLWRWLTFLGMMTASLAVGCELFMQAHPDSSMHRFAGPVEPRKARSPERLNILFDRHLNAVSMPISSIASAYVINCGHSLRSRHGGTSTIKSFSMGEIQRSSTSLSRI
jgi:hypothetical protein